MVEVTCPDCGTPVELKVMREPGERRRPFLVDADGSGMRRHWCPPPEVERETFDTCNSCGALWVRFGDGPRLDMVTHQPHVCPTLAPVTPPRMPDPPRRASEQPPAIKPWRIIP